MKEEIKKALEQATQGPWEYQKGHYGRNHLVSQVETGNVVCMGKTFEKTESDFHLIANAPTWLQWQNERIEQLEKQNDFLVSNGSLALQTAAERIDQLEKKLEWANRIIGSGMDVGAQLRYDPMKWMVEYQENFRKEEQQ